MSVPCRSNILHLLGQGQSKETKGALALRRLGTETLALSVSCAPCGVFYIVQTSSSLAHSVGWVLLLPLFHRWGKKPNVLSQEGQEIDPRLGATLSSGSKDEIRPQLLTIL